MIYPQDAGDNYRHMVEVKQLAAAQGELKANILLIHGLGAGTGKTWQTSSKNTYLHEWLREESKNLGVWQVDYDAAKTEWAGHAMALPDRGRNILNALAAQEQLRSAPLVILAHSFGGLVVKSLLRSAENSSNDQYKQIFDRVRSVVFFGTPHSGAILANIGNFWDGFFKPSAASKTLDLDNPNLRELNIAYRELAARRDIAHLVFYEARPMGKLGIIVSAASADPGVSNQTLVAVDANHVELTHLKSKISGEFQAISKLINATIEKDNIKASILQDPIVHGHGAGERFIRNKHTRLQRQKTALLEAGEQRAFNVLICGTTSANALSKTSATAERLANLLRNENFSVRLGSDAASGEFSQNGTNPLQEELDYIKQECNAVVIFADAADSWSELGLFSWHFATDKKLRESGLDFILLVDHNHEANKFVQNGPFSFVNAHGYARYIDIEQTDLASVVDRLKSRRSVFTVDRRGRRRVSQ